MPLIMLACARGLLTMVARHVAAVLAFMVVHFTFATTMLVAATGRDHRFVLLGVQLG